MVPRKKYVLSDFQKFSTGKLATTFARVADIGHYEFVEKMYVDKKKRTKRCQMVLVGHSWRKRNGPPVWAHATAQIIRYYSGTGVEVTPLLDIHSSKIYYDPPFSYMGCTDNETLSAHAMAQQRKLDRARVEAVIHFIFLASGRVHRSLDVDNPHLLGNFESALTTFAHYLETRGNVKLILDNQPSTSAEEGSLVQNKTNLQITHKTTSENAVSQSRSIAVIPKKRAFIDSTDDASELSYQTINKRAFLAQYLEEHAELEQRVRDLTAELQERDTKINTTEAQLSREKTKHQKLLDQRKKWKDKYVKQRRLSAEATSTVEVAKQKEENIDWKAMLLEQEHKTEEFRLNCIALEEEKKKLHAEIKTLKTKTTRQRKTLARCQATALEMNVKEAAWNEAAKKQADELAKEKEARIFWQQKRRGRTGLRPPTIPADEGDDVVNRALVRAKYSQQDVKALQNAYGAHI